MITRGRIVLYGSLLIAVWIFAPLIIHGILQQLDPAFTVTDALGYASTLFAMLTVIAVLVGFYYNEQMLKDQRRNADIATRVAAITTLIGEHDKNHDINWERAMRAEAEITELRKEKTHLAQSRIQKLSEVSLRHLTICHNIVRDKTRFSDELTMLLEILQVPQPIVESSQEQVDGADDVSQSRKELIQ